MNPKNTEINYTVTQKGEELLDAQYTPKIPGPHIISVTFNNEEIPQSPIKVNVEPDVDVAKIKITGIDQSKFSFSFSFLIFFSFQNSLVCENFFFIISESDCAFILNLLKQLHLLANQLHLT